LTTTELILLVLRIVSGEVAAETPSPGHFYRTVRLIVALLIATLIPFLVDRYARRSSRVIR
jgi:hypothetical protein